MTTVRRNFHIQFHICFLTIPSARTRPYVRLSPSRSRGCRSDALRLFPAIIVIGKVSPP
jgi:hypothetical protein